LIDLLHEDTNRVLEKPFKEMSDEQGRSDSVVAAEYWDAYIARNKSIVVDIMTGQLKSTVKCIKCSHTSVSFDPLQSI
jgi:ubiquitin carboxyl-terminal hydrolase 4/11/15